MLIFIKFQSYKSIRIRLFCWLHRNKFRTSLTQDQPLVTPHSLATAGKVTERPPNTTSLTSAASTSSSIAPQGVGASVSDLPSTTPTPPSTASSETTGSQGLSTVVECTDWLDNILKGEDAPGTQGYALSRLYVDHTLKEHCPACPTLPSPTSPPPSNTGADSTNYHPAWIGVSFATVWAVLNVIDALIGDFPAIRKAGAGLTPGWKGKFLSILCRLLRQIFFLFFNNLKKNIHIIMFW